MNFLHTEKPVYCYGAAICIAMCFLLYIFPLDFFAGHGKFFEIGDAAQHASGSRIYLEDEWHFPPCNTMRLNAPEGTSIIYTDSIPLAGLVLKLFKPLLPDGFQYIGIWQIAIFISQTLASVFLLRTWGAKSLFSSIVISCFALSMPCLFARMGHTSLMTHSSFLVCLALYFYGMKKGITHRWFILLFSLVCASAGLIHPYLFAMCYAIFIAFSVDLLRTNRHVRQFLENIVLSLVLCVSTLLFAGYSFGGDTASGFGYYSMNLLSPFVGGLWVTPIEATKGQAEGFNYLGLGVLTLLPFACYFERKHIVATVKKYSALFVLMILFSIYAISNKVYIGTEFLFEYPVPSFLSGLFNAFRASGRFFWPVGYLCLFFVVFSFSKKKYIGMVVLPLALLLQMADVNPYLQGVKNIAKAPSESKLEGWAELLEGVTSFNAYPAFQPEKIHNYALSHDNILFLQRMSAHYGLTSNTGYIARASKENADFNSFEKKLDTNLYMTSQKAVFDHFEGESSSLPSLFVEALKLNACIVWNNAVLCKKGIQQHDLSALVPPARPLMTSRDLYTFEMREVGDVALPDNALGWYPKESWGVWANGKAAFLPLMLPTSEALQLVLDANFFLDPVKHPSFQIDIFVNGQKKESLTCSQENIGKPIKIIFSKEELVAAQGKMLVKFVFDAPASPAELGHSRDTRKLSLGLRNMTLERVAEPSASR